MGNLYFSVKNTAPERNVAKAEVIPTSTAQNSAVLTTVPHTLTCGSRKYRYIFSHIKLKLMNFINELDCRYKANCKHVGLGPTGRVPSEGVFLRDPIKYPRIYASFGENYGKLRTAKPTSATRI